MSAELIKALQNPSLYDYPVSGFEVIETHISWVILTGLYAYKIKKPVNFGFLDFTKLEDRRYFCEQELRLNQRLTDNLYLEVLPITGSNLHPEFKGMGTVIEYALKMRQFPQSQLLSQLHEQLTEEHIDQLAVQIAKFHQLTPAVSEDHALAQPEVIMAPVRQNFEQIRGLLPEDPQAFAQLKRLEEWAESTYQRLIVLLNKRRQAGCIRECHGDIHLNNAAVLDGKVVLFDCIEFNESFRLIDVTNDIAFLVMDLEDRKLYHLANRLLNRYLEETGDYEALVLMPFYKAYRAMVRAKVALFSLGHVHEQGLQEAVLAQYHKYTDLAERYTLLPKRALLITSGVSAVGKSMLSERIVEQYGAIRIRSDVERKRMFSQLSMDELYSKTNSERVYQRLNDLALLSLQAGYMTILDAAYLKQYERLKSMELAEKEVVPFLILSCEASFEVIEKNLAKRAILKNDPSDATLSIVKQQLIYREPLTAQEQAVSCVLDMQDNNKVGEFVSELGKLLKI